MRIFELESPVLAKIEAVVAPYIDGLTKKQPVLFLVYEPPEGYVSDILEGEVEGQKIEYGGVICCYAAELNFPKSSGSNDQTQDSESVLIIDHYGFGDPSATRQAVAEAQFRAEVLTTLSYKAIMDRQEIAGSATVPKNFGVAFEILEKYPVKIQKFPTMGPMETKRGICAYRATYQFKLTEDVPTEPLGLPFAGSDTIDSETYNPGSEPDEGA